MFERDAGPNLDPVFRTVYLMQTVTVAAILAGMGLAWWRGEADYSAYRLLNLSIYPLREGDPAVVGQPFLLLWLMIPSLLVSGLRGMTGMIVSPVTFRRVAQAVWFVAVLSLAHFYVNFGALAADRVALGEGTVRPGYWLTVTSTAILGALIASEWAIRPPLAREGASRPMDDAERIWRGDYQTCPYCGTLNEQDAIACINCNNLLFNFTHSSAHDD